MKLEPGQTYGEWFDASFPGGDWFAAGWWRQTSVYAGAPATVDRAMVALAGLADPSWFVAHARKGGATPMHPLSWPLAHPGSWGAWAALCLGLDLADAGPVPDVVLARLRGTDLAMFHGAASEVSAAAAMKRFGLRFSWYPQEGGEFLIENDPIRYVEVKHPRYTSERADDELMRLMELQANVMSAFSDVRVSFHPVPELLDDFSLQCSPSRG